MTGARSPACVFVSDLHGRLERYRALFDVVVAERPDAVFLGGDLLPHAFARPPHGGRVAGDFIGEVIADGFRRVRVQLGAKSPAVFLILGNDDPRAEEPAFEAGEREGLWHYAHGRRFEWRDFIVYGYACVPPTPFRLKDWERYDVSRYVDPGCLSPEEGWRTVAVDPGEVRAATIADDVRALARDDQTRAIWLFHSPPYDTPLDRAGLDGKFVDHVPLDPHVGSIAIRRFIDTRQPLVTLHGHIHEAARLTGTWRTQLGRTHCLQAAHDGPELSVVRFDPWRLEAATRELIT